MRANVIRLSLLGKFGCPSKYLTMIVQLTGKSDVAVISPNIYQHKWFTSKTICCPTVFNSLYHIETNYRGNKLQAQHISACAKMAMYSTQSISRSTIRTLYRWSSSGHSLRRNTLTDNALLMTTTIDCHRQWWFLWPQHPTNV